MTKIPKNAYVCLQLNNIKINAVGPTIALRKAIRKVIYNAKQKKKDINLFETFKNINISLVCLQTNKEINYIFSIVKPTREHNGLYYKLDYEIEVYRKIQNM